MHDLDVVVDRLVLKDGIKGRLTDSVELALKLGEGRLLVQAGDDEPFWMSERFACVDCGISLPPIEPRMFSFNGPHGACPTCDGLGARDVVDPERCIGDPRHTLREGVVLAWGRRGSVALAVRALGAPSTRSASAPTSPWAKLPEEQREAILFGGDGPPGRSAADRRTAASARAAGDTHTWASCRGSRSASRRSPTCASRTPTKKTRTPARAASRDDELGRFLVTRTCDACKGKRLRPEALAVKLGGKDVAQVGAMPLRHVRKFVESLGVEPPDGAAPPQVFGPRERAIAEPLLKAVAARLGFLIDVGLDYLALDRSAQTLSSGEGQRIRLATQIGAALVGVLYVLDEPSVGPPRARQRAPHRGAGAPARSRQHRHRRRARSRGDPRGRPRRRHGPGRGRPRRRDHRAGDAARDHGQPEVDHRPVAERPPAAPDPVEAHARGRRRASASSARARTTSAT